MKNTLSSSDCARILKAMGDPTRLRILRHLVQGEKNVSELVTELDIDQPSVSHHLALLRQSGLVQEDRQGKHVYNRLSSRIHSQQLSRELEKIDFGCCSVEIRTE